MGHVCRSLSLFHGLQAPLKSVQLLVCFLAFAFSVGRPLPASAEPQSREYQLKAAFLYKFTNFVAWDDPSGVEEPLSICIVGRDPFGGVLQEVIAVNDPGFSHTRIEYPTTSKEFYRCRLAFVSRSKSSDVERLLDAVRDLPVVTVSDIPNFAESGGIIELVVDGDSIRFIINQRQARQVGIRLSSQLLSLAKSIIVEESE